MGWGEDGAAMVSCERGGQQLGDGGLGGGWGREDLEGRKGGEAGGGG